MVKPSRGYRNNNPGNIRHSNEKWQGMSVLQPDNQFVSFKTMAYGFRAMAKLLLTYYRKYKLNTVKGIIGRWAPYNENNTKAYIDFVCRQLLVQPDTPINVESEGILIQLCAAIATMENGAKPNMIDLEEGVNMALK